MVIGAPLAAQPSSVSSSGRSTRPNRSSTALTNAGSLPSEEGVGDVDILADDDTGRHAGGGAFRRRQRAGSRAAPLPSAPAGQLRRGSPTPCRRLAANAMPCTRTRSANRTSSASAIESCSSSVRPASASLQKLRQDYPLGSAAGNRHLIEGLNGKDRAALRATAARSASVATSSWSISLTAGTIQRCVSCRSYADRLRPRPPRPCRGGRRRARSSACSRFSTVNNAITEGETCCTARSCSARAQSRRRHSHSGWSRRGSRSPARCSRRNAAVRRRTRERTAIGWPPGFRRRPAPRPLRSWRPAASTAVAPRTSSSAISS